ncbi:type IX secretion system outer membrane channel protein PorV [Flavobacterium ginsenosidimutans]|uniref:type IX secretion system outer membrane channel protein PorV n=1 Tax=Flavobacterium ginsenosidimutans TaxID=687844 RepID=UPI000DAB5F96|nr:type IX secretion system outer membrane channel protein PorV [Flavobacterium ginsenosidimutans]KAF2328161.1 type IX secretion system outer membrane channel protein PorV [Flavobacterium ginsenosidimutans]
MKKIFLLFILLFGVGNLLAQEQNRAIVTAVPFLQVSADARASGIGDMGVATSADVYSQQWNAAKYPFAEDKLGIGLSYTPYMSSLSNDTGLLNLNFYNKINERSAFAFSLRYFGIGETLFKQDEDDAGQIVKPNELAFDGSYSLKLSEKFAMSVTGRYIHSNLEIQQGNSSGHASGSFAVDIAGYFQTEETAFKNFNGIWRAGFNISNLGPKLKYNGDSGSESFLPANLKVGGGFDFIFDQDNTLAASMEFNKLLVPSPQNDQTNAQYQETGFVKGAFSSFTDAPGGFSEELKEVTWALGLEYLYQKSFALRTGYFHESSEKGNRKYLTLGAGFKYKKVKFDFSYLSSAAKQKSPLDNMIRFSLSFNIGDNATVGIEEQEQEKPAN